MEFHCLSKPRKLQSSRCVSNPRAFIFSRTAVRQGNAMKEIKRVRMSWRIGGVRDAKGCQCESSSKRNAGKVIGRSFFHRCINDNEIVRSRKVISRDYPRRIFLGSHGSLCNLGQSRGIRNHVTPHTEGKKEKEHDQFARIVLFRGVAK